MAFPPYRLPVTPAYDPQIEVNVLYGKQRVIELIWVNPDQDITIVSDLSKKKTADE